MHSHKARPLLIEITVRSHDRIRGRCSQCQRSAPGYDRLPERRWRFVPLWGIPTSFLYPPRRVECTEHGVVVEHIPWSHGKRPVTCAMMGFLARRSEEHTSELQSHLNLLCRLLLDRTT